MKRGGGSRSYRDDDEAVDSATAPSLSRDTFGHSLRQFTAI